MSCAAKVQQPIMPLLQQKKPNPTPPTGMGSTLNEQEMLTHSKHDPVECYSDNGYPTLPRPKVILSLRHSDTGWSPQQASLLQTVPVRILNYNDNEQHTPVERSRSLSLDTASQLPLQSSLPTVDTERKQSNRDFNKPSTSTVNTTSTPQNSVVRKSRVVRSKSLSSTHTKVSNSYNSVEPVCSSPLLTDCRDQYSLAVQNSLEDSLEMSTNRNRVLSRKTASEGTPSSTASLNRPKKSRKITRAITFSFGVGSDKKRKSLGFLGSKSRRQSDDPDLLCVPSSANVTPSSPILMGRRRTPLAGSSSVHDFQQHSIVEEKDSCDSDWGSAQVYPRHENGPPILRNHFGSCRDFNSIDESEPRIKSRTPLFIPADRRDTNSPVLDYSPTFTPTSGMSSRQDSFESLSLSMRSEPDPRHTVSNPPSRSQSPNLWRSGFRDHPVATPVRERKMSDPAPSTPDLNDQESASPVLSTVSPRGSQLKKRNTFCVRQTRQTHKPGWHEMRHHVVRFLLETEQSYVQSLKTIIKVYMEPLYRPQAVALIEPSLAKDIFNQIPEVYRLHEKFLGQVIARVEGWNADSKIGDVFINTFSRCQLMDIYSKFIGNFMRAKSAIEIAKQARPVFTKFLEQRSKDSKGRFTLDDLLIKPVQRIPRYVLFIKDLLKHTSVSHPDHAPLQQALGELTTLAERVNASERDRGRLEEQRELIAAVDGLAHLIKPQSRFIRYDMVTEIKGNVQKRDRFLILFSDMVVCACARRKSTGFIRGSLLNLNSVFSDVLKHTVKWHAPLTEVSRAQLQGPTFDKRRQNTVEKILENLKKDESTLQQMTELSAILQTPHQLLASTLKNMQSDIREKIAEKKAELDTLPVESGRIDLVSYSTPSPTQYALVFPSQRIRNSWQVDFIDAKSKADRQAPPNANVAPPTSPIPRPPPNDLSTELNFLHSVLLQSGRIGTELTCGAVGLPVGCESPNCLWVCCGNMYGGQVSIMDLLPTTSSHALANITVSDSRITCISAVPTHPSHAHTSPTSRETSSLPPTISVDSFVSSESVSGSSSDSDAQISHSLSSCSEDVSKLDQQGSKLDDSLSNLDQQGSKLEDSLSNLEDSFSIVNGPTTELTNELLQTDDLEYKQLRSNSAPPFPDPSHSESREEMTFSPEDDVSTTPKLFSPLTLRSANLEWEGLGGEECRHCMWLGTEEGRVYVYSPGNNLRSRSQRQCTELGAPISCMRYYEGHVYVGLADGSLVIFDSRNSCLRPVSCVSVSSVPVVTCVPLMTGMGVCSGDTLYSLSSDKLNVTALATLPPGQVICDAVSVGSGVWVSVGGSPILHLLHMPSGQVLTTVDCTHTVMKILQGYNPIIRQHKSSSLQVTRLLATPSHLVVGTSAGVVVTIPLPSVEPSFEPHPLTHPPTPDALLKGHIGPINFLTSITRGHTTLIVTGGIGCEDFVTMATSQDVPETCSCLLVWSFNN